MTTMQDCSVGLEIESTYKTGVTPTRWPEFVDEDMDWAKNVVQGKGLRVGARVARSGRRVVTTAQGSGGFSMECVSKGMGKIWQLAVGAGAATLVSGTTWQHVFTLADVMPSATIQKGVVEAGGTVDPYTFLGCVADSFEIACPNGDIATLKLGLDMGDLTTATGYTPPSYVTTPNLFHFANGSIATGTLTAPTAIALASATGTLADVRSATVSVNHNLRDDRFNFGGGGRKTKPTTGLRDIACNLEVEYDSTTFRDAVLNETPMCVILNYTAGALSAGVEQLQIVLPEVKFNGELPKTNGADLIVQSMSGAVLDNLTAAQPIWVVTRTSDSAL